jgi:hypothetical protein
VATITIQAPGRPEAQELSGRLGDYHRELVEVAGGRWAIRVDGPVDTDRLAAEVIGICCSWVDETGAECVVELDGRRYPLHPSHANAIVE